MIFPPVAVQQAGVIYGHVCGLAGPTEAHTFSLNVLPPFTTTENLTNNRKFPNKIEDSALRRYSPISKRDSALRFEITALPLILKKILLSSL